MARLGSEELEWFVQSAPVALLVLDPAGAVTAANASAAALIGESVQHIYGRGALGLFDSADGERVRDLLQADGGQGPTAAVRLRRGDGEERFVELSAGPPAPAAGGGPARLLVLSDVTERVLRERGRETVEHAQAFLAETGALLESSLDPVQTLQRIASLAVPAHAELCVIDLLADDGALEGVGLAATDPEVARALAEVRREQPLERDGRHPVARVLREGRPMLVGDMDDSTYSEIAQPGPHLALIRKLRYHSAIVAPLTARGRTFGVISLLYLSPELSYTETDLEILVDVARRAALALDNARLYAREHRIAETLQRSLLPAQLPALPGLALAARYEPGEGDIGGDWYDALVLPEGRIGCVVGDIVGRGIDAASVMGQLRNVVRVYAHERDSTGEVVDAVDRFASSLGIGQMATLLYLIVDPARETIELSSAGHPPPLLVEPDGNARYLESGRSPPLALGTPVSHAGAVEPFRRGSTLVMYTDGLVERRGEPVERSLDELAALAASASADPRRLVDAVVERLRGAANPDDVAVFAIHSLTGGGC